MDDSWEVRGVIGRYRPPVFDRVVYSGGAVVFVLVGASDVSRDSAAAALWLVGGLVLAIRGWLLPATVVSMRGFRRGRLLRFTAWSEVVEVYPPPAKGSVQVRLRNNKLILLDGVGRDRLPGIVSLARSW